MQIGIYAAKVIGNGMRPRLRPGQYVIIDSSASYGPDDEVLIYRKDGTRALWIFLSRNGGKISVGDINERGEPQSLAEGDVDAIHALVGTTSRSEMMSALELA